MPRSSMLWCVLLAASAHATTFYVATTGNDQNAGTQAAPFKTIAKGLSVMGTGDTLYLRQGTYNESINSNSVTIPTGTSWANAPVIASAPGETATLAVGNASELVNLPHAYIQYVRFERLVLDGLGTTDNIISIGSSGAHHIRVQDCEVKNSGHIGIFLHGSSNIISGGSVHHIGNTTLFPRPPNRHYSFYVEGTDNVVEDLEIHHTNDYGIHNYSGKPQLSDRNTYRRLKIHDTSLLYSPGAAIIASRSNDVLIYNNVLYGNHGHGIIAGAEGVETYIFNNTVYGGEQSGIYVEPGSMTAVVRNNIAFGNATSQLIEQGTNTTASNNLTLDPQFTDAGAFDFSLQATSPAIDTGVTLAQVTDDYRGVSRPQGSAYDIGAYEWSAPVVVDMLAPKPPSALQVE